MFWNETPFCDLGQPIEHFNISVDIYTYQMGIIIILRAAVRIKGDAKHTVLSSRLDLKKKICFLLPLDRTLFVKWREVMGNLKLIVTECYY